MAITVYPDRIQFTNYSLSIDDNGLKVSGNGIFSSTVLQNGLGGFGVVSGYTSGGTISPATNIIDKFPFASNANASDVGDLTISRSESAGQSSSVSGYTSGGWQPGFSNSIDKFSFATNSNATDVGDLTEARYGATGQSSSVSGYTSGGIPAPLTLTNVIDKFPFAADGNATDVGDLTSRRGASAGQSSTLSGYTSGGSVPSTPAPSKTNIIDKFPFATNANATDVGDLTVARYYVTGQSSDVSGYTSGGYALPAVPFAFYNVIDKFSFATNGNATDVGDLTVARQSSAGQSSSVSGYTSGGFSTPPVVYYNVIDKFPFATNANAIDVGDLTVGRQASVGQQY